MKVRALVALVALTGSAFGQESSSSQSAFPSMPPNATVAGLGNDTSSGSMGSSSVTSMSMAMSSSMASSGAPVSAMSSMSGMMSSMAGTATGAGAIPAPVPTGSSNSTGAANDTSSSSGSSGYSCERGLLTYYITIVEYTGVPLRTATTYFRNWTHAVAGTLTNSSGSEAVGATRTYEAGGLSISEQLVYVEPNSTTGSLRQRWNSTKALTVAGIDIYTFTDDLTVYRNTTTNETNVQLFINFCTSNQTAGRALVAQTLDAEVAAWYSILSGQNATGTATTAAVGGGSSGSSMTPSVSPSASGRSSMMSSSMASSSMTANTSMAMNTSMAALPTAPGPVSVATSLPLASSTGGMRIRPRHLR